MTSFFHSGGAPSAPLAPPVGGQGGAATPPLPAPLSGTPAFLGFLVVTVAGRTPVLLLHALQLQVLLSCSYFPLFPLLLMLLHLQ